MMLTIPYACPAGIEDRSAWNDPKDLLIQLPFDFLNLFVFGVLGGVLHGCLWCFGAI